VRYHAGFGTQVVTTGQVAGLTEPLVGLTQEPLLGTRPKNPGQLPPIRSDVACMTQQPPNLTAQVGGAETTKALP
jgi:hypothetical protein